MKKKIALLLIFVMVLSVTNVGTEMTANAADNRTTATVLPLDGNYSSDQWFYTDDFTDVVQDNNSV